jgi:Zn-dependent protease with chaperone function
MEKDTHRSKMRPDTVKYGIIFLFCGWLGHYVFYFSKFSGEMPLKTTLLQLGVGIGICCFVATLKRWARMLCLFFNIGIIALYALYCLAYFQSNFYSLMLLTGLIAVLFAISTYFLLKKETAQFYAAANPGVDRQEPPDN